MSFQSTLETLQACRPGKLRGLGAVSNQGGGFKAMNPMDWSDLNEVELDPIPLVPTRDPTLAEQVAEQLERL